MSATVLQTVVARCRNCNSALGMLADDPECFLRAAAYLKRND